MAGKNTRKLRGLLIESYLGTGHDLSPGGGAVRILGGDHLILEEQKGGLVITENPKGGIAENFGRIQRGNHSNLL